MDKQATDEPRHGRAHLKNTRRWCRGAKGVTHVTEIAIPENAISQLCNVSKYDDESWWSEVNWEIGCFHVELCVNCGKHVRPFLNKGECPARHNDAEARRPISSGTDTDMNTKAST